MVFRNAASTCGEEPVRTRQASSPSDTSRTWCSAFSIPQCARTSPSNRAASARERSRLVRTYATATVATPFTRRSRATRTT